MQMDRRSRSEMRYICETGEFQTWSETGKGHGSEDNGR